MFVERACGDPLRQGLSELHGRSLDDVARHAVNLAIVNGLGQIVRSPRWSQIEVQLDAHDKRLAEIMLGPQRSVVAVEDHVGKKYAILAHSFISLLIIVFVVRVQFLDDAQGGRGWLVLLCR